MIKITKKFDEYKQFFLAENNLVEGALNNKGQPLVAFPGFCEGAIKTFGTIEEVVAGTKDMTEADAMAYIDAGWAEYYVE